MRLSQIKLINWRNYSKLQLELQPGINYLVGENGCGKTNIAEAIDFISTTRSWRTLKNSELIKDGEDEAYVKYVLNVGLTEYVIEVALTKTSKTIKLNGDNIKRISELSKISNTVCFTPRDTFLFKDPPSVRRRYLDMSISKTNLLYQDNLTRYQGLLKERNACLKDNKVNVVYLETITNQIIELEKSIIECRNDYIYMMNCKLEWLAPLLFGSENNLKVSYKPFINVNDNFIAEAKNAYKKVLNEDLKYQSTSIGIHREDFQVLLNGKNIAVYGSRGENRLSAICIKLIPYFLVDNSNKKPIVILDDVYSELDKLHRESLTKIVSEMEQVIITGTEDDLLRANIIDVGSNNAIVRR